MWPVLAPGHRPQAHTSCFSYDLLPLARRCQDRGSFVGDPVDPTLRLLLDERQMGKAGLSLGLIL